MHDTGCAVATLDPQGTLRSCNSAFADFRRESAGAEQGVPSIDDLLDEPSLTAHFRAQRAVLLHGIPVSIDGTFAGRRSVATYRRIDTPTGTHLLLVVARWTPETQYPEDAEVVTLRPDATDKIASLTPREVDVLRGIAQGLSTAEIADKLHRSTKTIEGHRVSLGVKLDARNRVELAQIAWLSGIAPLAETNRHT